MAIDYIKTKKEYLLLRKQCEEIFKIDKTFPDNLFHPNYQYKLFFENGIEDTEPIYKYLIEFVKDIGDHSLTFFTITPDPESYFYKNFRKYSAATFSINEEYESFINFLKKDPGGSPADALAFNSEVSVLYSESLTWGLITSKDTEMGVIGFGKRYIYEKFNNLFSKYNVFVQLPEYLDHWRNLLHKKELPPIWLEFEKNYMND